MKKFWSDYKHLSKHTGEFYKNHWKGVIVLNAAIIGVELVAWKIADIKHEKKLEKF